MLCMHSANACLLPWAPELTGVGRVAAGGVLRPEWLELEITTIAATAATTHTTAPNASVTTDVAFSGLGGGWGNQLGLESPPLMSPASARGAAAPA
jgi:hypothetical protein